MGTGLRARTAIGQPGQAVVAIAAQPVVDGLAGHAIADCDVGHRRPVEDFDDRLQALLHQTQLHQHRGPPSFLRTWTAGSSDLSGESLVAGGPLERDEGASRWSCETPNKK